MEAGALLPFFLNGVPSYTREEQIFQAAVTVGVLSDASLNQMFVCVDGRCCSQ